jgi:PST family polysaccharide transporter
MGFIILAKGARALFLWIEIAAAVVHIGLAWLFIPYAGPEGAGAAFCALYVWHGLLVYVIVRRVTDFRWSPASRKLGVTFVGVMTIVFAAVYLLPFWTGTVIGIVAVGWSSVYSMHMLMDLLPESFGVARKLWFARAGGISRARHGGITQ